MNQAKPVINSFNFNKPASNTFDFINPPTTWGEWPFLIKQGGRTELIETKNIARYHTYTGQKVPVVTTAVNPVKIYPAYSSNLTLINNIRYHKHAKIVNNPGKNGCTLKSIFTLKVFFKKEARKGPSDHFVYRSDRYPKKNLREEFENIYKLASSYTEISDTMMLFDNRRAAPDDLLIKWKQGLVIFQHEFIPFGKSDPVITPGIERIMQDFSMNHNKELHLEIKQTYGTI